MNIGSHLRALRKKQKMKAENIAEIVGVSTPTVTRWENGAIDIPGSMIEKYLSALKLPIKTILSANYDTVVNHAEKMNLNEDQKAALEEYKKMPLTERQRRLANILDKYNSLSETDQEAISKIITSLSSRQ